MASSCKLKLSYYSKPDYLRNTTALGNKILSKLEEDTCIKNCLNFYVETANQIYKRFPFNSREMEILKMLSFLNPSHIQPTESLGPIGAKFPHHKKFKRIR